MNRHEDEVSFVNISDDEVSLANLSCRYQRAHDYPQDEDEVVATTGDLKSVRGATTPGISPLSDSTTLARLSCTSTPKVWHSYS
jgi:hypothetical protein